MAYSYKNILRLQGNEEAAQTAIRAITKANGCINFGKITPTPLWAKRRANLLRSWRMENWGSTENAKPAGDDEPHYAPNLLVFYTSGSDVHELIRKLSLMFPVLVFDYIWASENIGQDAGTTQFKDGNLLSEYIAEPDSVRAYELTFDILGTTAKAHGLDFDANCGTYRRTIRKEGD